jgi:ketosteroid isomerase-like protein
MDDDVRTLTEINTRFLGAWQVGSREQLGLVLDPDFVYFDGVTGETTDRDGYMARLTGPVASLAFDQTLVHVFGDTAVVTARTTRDGTSYNRYVDTYRRAEGGWRCVHGCLWPVPV